MTLRKRTLAVLGTGLFAASLSVLPLGAASAASSKDASALGNIGENSVMSVQTEYNCNTHTITAEVTNKTDEDLRPTITFDGKQPLFPDTTPIPPDQIGVYSYGFDGSNQKIRVSAGVEGQRNLIIQPSINCQEPVTFDATISSQHMIAGYLTNNNSVYPQSVLLRSFNGSEVRVTLQPNESSLVSVPYDVLGTDYLVIGVNVGTEFESSYTYDLSQQILDIPPVE